MQSLQDSDISTIIAITLVLAVNATVVLLGHVNCQVELDVGEFSSPGSYSRNTLFDRWVSCQSQLRFKICLQRKQTIATPKHHQLAGLVLRCSIYLVQNPPLDGDVFASKAAWLMQGCTQDWC